MRTNVILLTTMPGVAFAHGGHAPVAEPFHTLSHSGHIVGAFIIVGALIAFLRQRDRS
jgi:putative copper export protein